MAAGMKDVASLAGVAVGTVSNVLNHPDAVLGFIIADALFQECPEMNEGQKSKIKASLVSTQTLGFIGERLELGPYLLLGRGEEKTGGRRKMALLADACEALIAAIYLDGGLDAARTFVRRELWSMRGDVSQPGTGVVTNIAGDYKSALQELLQSQDRGLPNYRVVAEQGPDHRKTFEVELSVAGATVARAEGRSKKEAEQQAAESAWRAIRSAADERAAAAKKAAAGTARSNGSVPDGATADKAVPADGSADATPA